MTLIYRGIPYQQALDIAHLPTAAMGRYRGQDCEIPTALEQQPSLGMQLTYRSQTYFC